MHALVILSHFHALSSFVFGCGIGDGEQEPPSCLLPSQSTSPTLLSPTNRPAEFVLSTPSSSSVTAASAALQASAADASFKGAADSVRDPVTAYPLYVMPNFSVAAPVFVQRSASSSGAGSPNGSVSSRGSPISRRGSPTGSVGGLDQEVGLDALMRRMKSLSERREEFSAEEQTKR